MTTMTVPTMIMTRTEKNSAKKEDTERRMLFLWCDTVHSGKKFTNISIGYTTSMFRAIFACRTFPLALNMEAVYPSEMLVNFFQSVRCHAERRMLFNGVTPYTLEEVH
jgi:hypothetical protein